MTRLLLAACFCLTSCATRLYSPTTGKPLATIYSNAAHLSYTGGGCTLDATGLNNSTPTNSAGRIIGTLAADTASVLMPGSGVLPTVARGTTIIAHPLFAPKTTTP